MTLNERLDQLRAEVASGQEAITSRIAMGERVPPAASEALCFSLGALAALKSVQLGAFSDVVVAGTTCPVVNGGACVNGGRVAG